MKTLISSIQLLVILFGVGITNPLSAASFNDIDVVNYRIRLDVTDFDNKQLKGHTTVTFKLLIQSDSLLLLFEGLQVDSILIASKRFGYEHSGMKLIIDVKDAFKLAEEGKVDIYYSGKPINEGWGGFHFKTPYAYNLGVGFATDPHNYGRVWFPCVDNFTDKATYDFEIITSAENVAFCNGVLTDTTHLSDSNILWNWEMDEVISTYLASVAVAPYVVNSYRHKGIPVDLVSLKEDSVAMARSFMNLPKAIDAFINAYGEHHFDRIGFNLVPMGGGAMEHATNISFPVSWADGLLTHESTVVHELAHHWWGNAITCETAEDMWINEGWASYSENIFWDWAYGRDRYKQEVSNNHKSVLHWAHLRDSDALPVSGIGTDDTYGSHVYSKGSDVIHTLRGYMGDSAFLAASKSFVQSNVFKNVNSDDLKKHFQTFTTADLNAFFNDWIYNPGFPAFDVLEWNTKEVSESFENKIRIRQRLKFTEKPFAKVPLEITAVSSDFQMFTASVITTTQDDWFTILTPFKPVTWLIDLDEKISDAMTDKAMMIRDTGTYVFGDALMQIHVDAHNDSSWVRVEHYWVGPDAWFNEGNQPFLSRERYWRVDGVLNSEFSATATIEYNGRNSGANYPAGYLDNDLIRVREDSLVLMYRTTASSQWEIHPDYELNMRSPFDKIGSIAINNLKKGEYSLAIRDWNLLGVEKVITATDSYLHIYPNPTRAKLNFEVSGAANAFLEITSSSGQVIYSRRIKKDECKFSVDTTSWGRGIYYAGLIIDNQPYTPKMLFVR